MHIAIGHYSIGARDGVNTVIWRTVNQLLQIDPSLHVCLFGKTCEGIDKFLPWHNSQLRYVDVPELSPGYKIPGLEGKDIRIQRVHDYIWHGTNVAEELREQFADEDIIMMENLSVGVNPAVMYAFYLWTLWEYQAGSSKRFLVRVHDFAQQRPDNFKNIKKFRTYLPNEMPDWHQILYPCTPNVEYIAINTPDYYRLMDHGIEPSHIWYVPNSIDDSLSRCEEPTVELRELLNERKGIDPHAAILFYPVRAIPRKNVEEAMFLLKLFNRLAEQEEHRQRYNLDAKYHLVVSLDGGSDEEKRYAQRLRDYAAERDLPVTIDISDLVGLQRKYDPEQPENILRYGVADMYSISRMTISTSVLEGFGFVFIEPWVLEHCVVGRNIPAVTMDFTKAGMSLEHLYNALLVEGTDYADLGSGNTDGGLAARLEAIDRLDDENFVNKFWNANKTALQSMLRLFRHDRRQDPRRSLVRANRKKALENYSSKEVVGLLYRIMDKTEPTYIDPRRATKSSAAKKETEVKDAPVAM